jgi:hypothetical protein
MSTKWIITKRYEDLELLFQTPFHSWLILEDPGSKIDGASAHVGELWDLTFTRRKNHVVEMELCVFLLSKDLGFDPHVPKLPRELKRLKDGEVKLACGELSCLKLACGKAHEHHASITDVFCG